MGTPAWPAEAITSQASRRVRESTGSGIFLRAPAGENSASPVDSVVTARRRSCRSSALPAQPLRCRPLAALPSRPRIPIELPALTLARVASLSRMPTSSSRTATFAPDYSVRVDPEPKGVTSSTVLSKTACAVVPCIRLGNGHQFRRLKF